MRYSVLLAYILFCISANSQTNVPLLVSDTDSIYSPRLTGETFIDLKKYTGNQYIQEDWVEADMLLSTGETAYKSKIKYNGLLDEVIWINPYSLRKIKVDKQQISEFWFKNSQGESIHFKKIRVDNPTTNEKTDIFAEVAVEGKVSLYIQRKITKIGQENRFNEDKLYTFDVIGPKPAYYIKLPSNRYVAMTIIRRNSFLKLFPAERKSIIKLLNKNHLNFKTESSFAKIIELINTEIFL